MFGPLPDWPTFSVRSHRIALSPAVTVILPDGMFSSCSDLIASLTFAVTFRVSCLMVRLAPEAGRSPSAARSVPPLIPFLPFAMTLSVPLPAIVRRQPSLAFMTAFSAFVFSGCSSSLLYDVSARRLTVPEFTESVTSVPLLHRIGAVFALVRSRPFSTMVTPVVPFFTVTFPSVQLPFKTYVPAACIFSAVPSIVKLSSSSADAVMPLFVKVNVIDPDEAPVSASAHAGTASGKIASVNARSRAANLLMVLILCPFRSWFADGRGFRRPAPPVLAIL